MRVAAYNIPVISLRLRPRTENLVGLQDSPVLGNFYFLFCFVTSGAHLAPRVEDLLILHLHVKLRFAILLPHNAGLHSQTTATLLEDVRNTFAARLPEIVGF